MLGSHWEKLRQERGDFSVQHPLSEAMRQFLLRPAKDSIWYESYQTGNMNVVAINQQLIVKSSKS
jgi:hypothetical protein